MRRLGQFQLQAAVAALHAEAATPAATDWPQIAAIYDELFAAQSTPVVALNRAAAHGMAHGPDAGLRLLDAIEEGEALASYYLLPAARADLLRRAGRRGGGGLPPRNRPLCERGGAPLPRTASSRGDRLTARA
jgi:RNA polymerase sigma-70 factor (ECF subfamily)